MQQRQATVCLSCRCPSDMATGLPLVRPRACLSRRHMDSPHQPCTVVAASRRCAPELCRTLSSRPCLYCHDLAFIAPSRRWLAGRLTPTLHHYCVFAGTFPSHPCWAASRRSEQPASSSPAHLTAFKPLCASPASAAGSSCPLFCQQEEREEREGEYVENRNVMRRDTSPWMDGGKGDKVD